MKALTVYITPIGKGRPRMTKSGHVFTPSATRTAEQTIRNEWIDRHGGEPLWAKEEALVLTVRAFFFRPPSVSKRRLYPTIKPDADNILKIFDALNKVAFIDDSQIVDAYVSKRYGLPERLEIELATVEEMLTATNGNSS